MSNVYSFLLNSDFKYLENLNELLDKLKKMYSIYDEKSKYISNINLDTPGEIEILVENAINKNENGEIDYTDSLGIFDLNRKKIIECLIKNHDYNEKSEVGEYIRRLVK